MAQVYDRKTLAFILADLGEELGRAPRPSDLRPGMPSKATYLRHFDNWTEALEYAGYVESLEPKARIVNLLGRPVVFKNIQGEISDVLIPEGKAAIAWSNVKTPAASLELAPLVNHVPVTTNRINDVCIRRENGGRVGLPDPQPGVYYLVPEFIARNIRCIGRSNEDIIFPAHSYVCSKQPGVKYSYTSDEYLYILSLGMVYSGKLHCIR